MPRPYRTLAALLPLALFACAIDEEPSDEVSLAISCTVWDCGNSATVDGDLAFHEIDASGSAANDVGLKLERFRQGEIDLHLVVVGDEIRARLKTPGQPYPGTGPWYGGSLVGAAMTVSVNGVRQDIVIEAIGEITAWVGPFPRRRIPTYRFAHGAPGAGQQYRRPVCKDPLPQNDPDWTGVYSTVAVVFQGDRYHRPTKQVFATGPGAGSWFNVGCAGSAMSKMHLMLQTEATKDPLSPTTRGERQAALKMITADYCGTGRSFTVNGEPLLFMSRRHPRFALPQPRFEAIWTEQGAYCLTEARRLMEDPAIFAMIQSECARVGRTLSSCGTVTSTSAVPGAFGFSANPF